MSRLAILEARVAVALRCLTVEMVREVLNGNFDHSIELKLEIEIAQHDINEYEKEKRT